ncbi:glutamic acid-rich protein [Drosophila rhopaloa]|uniref:Uncharacterized protein n=1 Tax=Drosophila rhopaloa TaxID=1041015 RepID=A0ABM5JFG9_DRORH|nr:glutamic acid-rich protein [Drosophila rhopaloa]
MQPYKNLRAWLLLALFGCVLLATVSANPVDIDELNDEDEDKGIADEKENFEEDEEDDQEADTSKSQDDLDASGSQDEPKKDVEEERDESSQNEEDIE